MILVLDEESYEAINDRVFKAVIILLNIRSVRSWKRILGRQEVLLIYDFMKGPAARLSKIERDRVITELKDCKKTE